MKSPYQIKIADFLSPELFAQWLTLWENHPNANFVNSPFWFRSVLNSFRYKNYKIILIYRNGDLVSLSCFFMVERFGLAFYTTPPTDFVYGMPFLIDINDRELIVTLVNYFLSLGNVFLDNVPESLLLLIRDTTPEVSSLNYCPNRYLELDQPEDLSKFIKNKKELIERARRVEKDLAFKLFTGDPLDGLKIAFAIDAKSSKHARGYDVFSHKLFRKFYTNIAKEFGGHFVIHFLYLKNQPIAYEIGFKIRDKYFWNQTAFDEALKDISPGRVSLVKLIEYLEANSFSLFDMGTGDSRLKREVSSKSGQFYKVILSKSPLVRFMAIFTYQLKKDIFAYLSNHRRLYLIYRRIRQIFLHEI